MTVRGVVREKGTGRPVAGTVIGVTVLNGTVKQPHSSVTTDDAGRYVISNVPRSREIWLFASAKLGEPYLLTSRKIEVANTDSPVTADVEVVRGIPFRVRVLDRDTGEPLKGALVYYPIKPNSPFERGVMGYTALVGKGGTAVGGILYFFP